MENSNTWKERDTRRPFYKLLEKETQDSHIGANWHGVSIAKVEPIIKFLPHFLKQHVRSACLKAVISFQDKLQGQRAHQWVREYGAANQIHLKLEKCTSTSFHLLQILGESTQDTLNTLFTKKTVSYEGIFAAISKYTSTTDLATPIGLMQIIQVTFQ